MKNFYSILSLLLWQCVLGQKQEFNQSLNLEPNKSYTVSVWVSQEDVNVVTFEKPYITVFIDALDDAQSGSETFLPQGPIIDGWQKIEGQFFLKDYETVDIILGNQLEITTYFDDLRIHPTESNVKSFVYDTETNRLSAELDENNFATFYEYDNEGGLIRVKKETERGVFTIQETRSSTKKE